MVMTIVVAAFGLLMLICSLVGTVQLKRTRNHGIHVIAQISDLQLKHTDDPDSTPECQCTLQFTDWHGEAQTVTVEGLTTDLVKTHKVGDAVEILCDPKDPRFVLLSGYADGRGLGAFLFTILGAWMVIIPLLSAFASR